MVDRRILHKSRLRLAVAAMAALLWAAAPLPAPASQIVDRIVAVVNDDAILSSELEDAMVPFLERLGQMNYTEEQQRQMRYKIREDILAQLIDRKLTDQEIKRVGLSVAPEEIDAAVERVKEANFLTDEALREAISRQGYTMEKYRQNVREQILRTKLVNREIRSRTVITGEDVKSYYDSHPEQFGGQRRYHLRTILLPRDLADLEARRQEVNAALENGMPFADAARRFSRAPQASEGGDLGAFALASLSAKVRAAVESLGEGQYGPWVDTEQGFQRFFVEKIDSAEAKPLQEVQAQIQETIYKQMVDEKFRTWLEALRKRSHIRIVK